LSRRYAAIDEVASPQLPEGGDNDVDLGIQYDLDQVRGSSREQTVLFLYPPGAVGLVGQKLSTWAKHLGPPASHDDLLPAHASMADVPKWLCSAITSSSDRLVQCALRGLR